MTTETRNQLWKLFRAISCATGVHPGDLNAFIEDWTQEESACTFPIGCPNWPDRAALVYLIYAARSLCAMDYGAAARLTKLAQEAIPSEEINPVDGDTPGTRMPVKFDSPASSPAPKRATAQFASMEVQR